MSYLLAEELITVQETSASPRSTADKTGPKDERVFAFSLIKHPRDPVLDVGTGDCACVARILASQGTQVVALDKDRKTIHAARAFLNNQSVKQTVRLLQDDITASGLASSVFRNIVCFNVLHHVSPLDRAIAELERILSCNGRLIISEYDENRDGFLKRLEHAVHSRFRSVTAYRRPAGRLVLSCER